MQRLVFTVVVIAALVVASTAVLYVQTREAAEFQLLSRALDRAGTFALAARAPGVDDGVLARMAEGLVDATVKHACLFTAAGDRRCTAPPPTGIDASDVQLQLLAVASKDHHVARTRADTFELWYPLTLASSAEPRLAPGPGPATVGGGDRVLLLVMDPAVAEGQVVQTLIHAVLITALLALLVLLTMRQVRLAGAEREREREMEAERHFAQLGRLGSVLAHEVRNPLGAIKGFAQYTMKRFDAEDPAREDMVTIVSEATRLEGLVDDLLRFARPRAIEACPGDVGAFAERISGLVRHAADEAGVTLTVAVDSESPVIAPIDEEQLTLALLNLVKNAVEAVAEDAGSVQVTVASSGSEVVIAVADDGPGVPPELRDKLFEPYVTGKATGTGLGLPTARRVVEGHGGTLTVDTSSAGTTFRLTLPAQLDGRPATVRG